MQPNTANNLYTPLLHPSTFTSSKKVWQDIDYRIKHFNSTQQRSRIERNLQWVQSAPSSSQRVVCINLYWCMQTIMGARDCAHVCCGLCTALIMRSLFTLLKSKSVPPSIFVVTMYHQRIINASSMHHWRTCAVLFSLRLITLCMSWINSTHESVHNEL